MPADEEVTLEVVYAEVDKRIKAAADALKAEIIAHLEKCGIKEKGKFRIVNRPASGS